VPNEADNQDAGKNAKSVEKPISWENAKKVMSPWESALTGATGQAASTGHGVEQLAQMLAGFQPNIAAEGYEVPFQENRARSEENLRQREMLNRQLLAESAEINPKSTMAGQLGFEALLGLTPLGWGKLATKSLTAAKFLGRVAQGTKHGVQAGAAGGATLGAIPYTMEDESRAKNMALGSLFGAGIGGTLGAGVSALNPINGIRGSATDQMLAENLAAAHGTETNLGRVLENPMLAHSYENILTNVPGSGAGQSIQRTGTSLEKTAENLVNKLESPYPEVSVEPKEAIVRSIQNEVNKRWETSRKGYAQMDQEADGLQVNRTNYQQEAINILREVHKDPDLLANLDKGMLNKLQRIANGTLKTTDIAGEMTGKAAPIGDLLSGTKMMKEAAKEQSFETRGSFNNSNILRGLELEQQRTYARAGELNLAGIQGRLANALSNDMEQAVTLSGNQKLADLWKKNNKYYKENIVPLSDPSITKFTNIKPGGEKVIDDVVSTFLKANPKKDASNSLAQLTNLLDEKGMSGLRDAIFQQARNSEGVIDVNQLLKTYNQLGKKQRELLFKDMPEIDKEFKQLMKMKELNPEAFLTMFNPPTGQKALPIKTLSTIGGAGLAMGGPGGVPIAFALASLGGKGLNKILTSEKIREQVVRKLMNPNAERGAKETGALEFQNAINQAITSELNKER
jgi:hypothetical protein